MLDLISLPISWNGRGIMSFVLWAFSEPRVSHPAVPRSDASASQSGPQLSFTGRLQRRRGLIRMMSSPTSRGQPLLVEQPRPPTPHTLGRARESAIDWVTVSAIKDSVFQFACTMGWSIGEYRATLSVARWATSHGQSSSFRPPPQWI